MATAAVGLGKVEAWETGGFTQQAMDSVAGMREKIKAMPFLSELVAGTLPPETFAHYLVQDSLYLHEYGKMLTGLADKATTPEAKENMSRAAANVSLVEGTLHETFLAELSVLSAEEREKVEASPTCQGYADFQQTALAVAPYEVAFASIMPCYTIYCEVGRWIESNAPSGIHPSS
jgi:thiaminase/transcriptional activator TenA